MNQINPWRIILPQLLAQQQDLLSPLADRCYAVSQLQNGIEFPSLQGFQQNLAGSFCSAPPSVPLPLAGAMVGDCCCGESQFQGIVCEHANCIPSRK